jgi:hypothetical protein
MDDANWSPRWMLAAIFMVAQVLLLLAVAAAFVTAEVYVTPQTRADADKV